ncbi:UNVERIFIED_ORG: hypothetical protein L601_002000000580 [Gordonia westfalica J30]
MTKIQPGMLIATISEWLLQHGDRKPLVILDTFGKGRPQPQRGDNPYLADYQAGSALKDLIDAFPGSCLLAVHHSRKAESDDFLDAVSGTQGLAGSADFILVLTRKRQSDEGALSITGRDVTETELAMTTSGGQWKLSGATVSEAHTALAARRERASQGDLSLDILTFVRGRSEMTTPTDVASQFAIDNKAAGTYLGRLVERGHIAKLGRGKYQATVESVESVETGPDGGPNSTHSTVSTPSCPTCRFPMSFPADLAAGQHITCKES